MERHITLEFIIDMEGCMRELLPTILTITVVAFVLGFGLDSVPKAAQAHEAVEFAGAGE
jgi:hypothetical protein